MEKAADKFLERPVKVRPYWHVDAKWICGLWAVAALGTGLLLSVAGRLSAPEPAVEIATVVLASSFSKDGLDTPFKPEDLAQLRQKIAKSSTGRIAPIENFPIATINAADLDLSPRDLRLKIFRQIVAPIYEDGVEGAAKKFTDDPLQQEQFVNDAFYFKFVTRQTHETISRAATIALGVGALFWLGVVLFSWRWGRLSNPGILLVIVGLPGTAVGLILQRAMEADPGDSPFAFVPPSVMPTVRDAFMAISPWLVLVGATMVLVAFVGGIVTRIVAGRRAAKAAGQSAGA